MPNDTLDEIEARIRLHAAGDLDALVLIEMVRARDRALDLARELVQLDEYESVAACKTAEMIPGSGNKLVDALAALDTPPAK